MSDKPSIAELLRVATQPGDPTQQSMLLRADVALTLLEVAAAALRYRESLPRFEVDTSRCELPGPVKVDTMTVSGKGSIGIDLDD